jgi:hypothetical protein
MKRTKMIRSIWLLMIAIFFDSLYFFFTTFSFGLNSYMGQVLLHPLLIIIPKSLLLGSMLYFLYCSLSPNDYSFQGRICPYDKCYLEKANQINKASELTTYKKKRRKEKWTGSK